MVLSKVDGVYWMSAVASENMCDVDAESKIMSGGLLEPNNTIKTHPTSQAPKSQRFSTARFALMTLLFAVTASVIWLGTTAMTATMAMAMAMVAIANLATTATTTAVIFLIVVLA
ncbi:hypothetical protein PILCRDRAFT_1529 [Piloderma croceum F 1598]|uniref:Uncharacterized protein n=1 Tax=Piloderma croceum (strain F 1598) TaxID=765440 RepID=A0A0C3CKH9_PILCF|nr:hypothetical protein PILCRDRAFT_1529 [Piloderma croceum F 1598]